MTFHKFTLTNIILNNNITLQNKSRIFSTLWYMHVILREDLNIIKIIYCTDNNKLKIILHDCMSHVHCGHRRTDANCLSVVEVYA